MGLKKTGMGRRIGSTVAALAMSVAMLVPTGMVVNAESLTIKGEVVNGTTADKLYLKASDGTWQIKLDSNTDFSESRVLITGNQVTANITRGSDGFFHATKLIQAEKVNGATTQTNITFVQGTVASETTPNLLYLSTSGGTMIFRMDTATDMSEIGVLTQGKNVGVKFTRGNDGYNHADKITGPQTLLQTQNVKGPNGQDTTMVNGTVEAESVSDKMFLKTPQGVMQIKIDSNTNTSGSKVIAANSTVIAYVYRGDDAYMHAAKLQSYPAGIDVNTVATVYGVAAKSTTTDLLVLTTGSGDMKIKMDASTNIEGNVVVKTGANLAVVVARGSDAYMHALTIADPNAANQSTGNGNTTTTTTNTTAGTSTSVSGTLLEGKVASDTNSEMLYLNTAGGTMKIKIDSNTDISACKLLVNDHNLVVDGYVGIDSYWHASKITSKDGQSNKSATVDTANTVVVTGVVTADSTEEIMNLVTAGGTMKIKLDAGTQMAAGMLRIGKYVKVTCGRGSDAYQHAIKIEKVN